MPAAFTALDLLEEVKLNVRAEKRIVKEATEKYLEDVVRGFTWYVQDITAHAIRLANFELLLEDITEGSKVADNLYVVCKVAVQNALNFHENKLRRWDPLRSTSPLHVIKNELDYQVSKDLINLYSQWLKNVTM
jgi:hypothetical protein